MAAQQTRADLAQKKKKLDLARIKDIWARIKDIWECHMSIKHENAKKIMPVAVDIALKGLTWEPEFTVPGQGTDVNIYIFTYILKVTKKFKIWWLSLSI